jgi:hypothetical protein
MRKLTMLVAVMVVMLAMSVAPAFAEKGRFPHRGSCGVSKEAVHGDLENTLSPGTN